MALAIAVVAFWSWIRIVQATRLNTRGFAGSVTMLLWGGYLIGVPFFALFVLGMALLSVMRRRASLTRSLMDVAVVLIVSAFWYWSLSASFDFLKD